MFFGKNISHKRLQKLLPKRFGKKIQGGFGKQGALMNIASVENEMLMKQIKSIVC
ncbi:MAG: hypothetical protein M3P08_05005 [Thermoproteota archaeon]|nr:hypothetical protein [Thermoproteota archaeon]